MSLLQIRDLNVQFHDKEKGQEAVRHLSFSAAPGEIVGIVGESGSGKSTAMQAVLGLLPDCAETVCGEILLGDADITPPLPGESRKEYERKMDRIRGDKIAMVFQNPQTSLNPTVKIGRQIVETIRAHSHCSRTAARRRAAELLDMAGIHDGESQMGKYPFELSGGMCQRVGIAIALSCGPELLIADEPTTALDATVQKQMLELFRRIVQETGTAVLFVSHDLGVIASLCDRVLVMHDGTLAEEGLVEDIYYNPQHAYTKTLLARAKELQKLSACRGDQKKLLEVSHVSRCFAGAGVPGRRDMTEAVRDVTFHIRRGETFGLVGESGCGKSTLARMVTGILAPTRGTVLYEGKAQSIRPGRQNRRVQMVFQNPYASLNPRMTVRDMLEEPLLLNTDMTEQERREKVDRMLTLVGLDPEEAQRYPRAFSGGERQRIGIARALMLEPGLLVCDEPVSALDMPIQEQILELLEELQDSRGITCLFISHDLNVVKRISSRIGVMYAGSIVETGHTKDVYNDPWHPYTKALLSSVLVPDPVKARRKKGMPHREEQKAEAFDAGGCPFAHRCGYALECCYTDRPKSCRFDGREVACFLYSEEYTGKRSRDYRMTSQI